MYSDRYWHAHTWQGVALSVGMDLYWVAGAVPAKWILPAPPS